MSRYGKVTNLSAFSNRDLLRAGYIPVEPEFINDHFSKRRCLGQGFYLVQKYSLSSNEPAVIFGGVTFEEKTPLNARANTITTILKESTSTFYGTIRDAASRGSRIESRREGHMSFLAVACKDGVIVAGYYDTAAERSQNGMNMLMYIMYRFGILNGNIDSVLGTNCANHLPFHEDLPTFNPTEIDQEMIDFYNGKAPQHS